MNWADGRPVDLQEVKGKTGSKSDEKAKKKL